MTLFALFSASLIVDYIVAYNITYEFEAQSFSWCTGLARTRPDGTRTVYLEVNQCVASGFLTRSMCSISVANVVYSNDGGSATVYVLINGTAVGYVTTRPLPSVAFSSPRDLWNIQRNSGAVGRVVTPLGYGSNEVTLVLNTSDCSGIEIDSITLNFVCDQDPNGGRGTPPSSSTSPPSSAPVPSNTGTTPVHSDSEVQMSPGTIAGIVVGGTAIVLLIIVLGTALCYWWKKYSNFVEVVL